MNIRYNMRLGIRSLRKSPAFTFTVAATLAIGIGLSTAVYTVASALLLKTLPVHDQAGLVLVSGQKRDVAAQPLPLSYAEVQAFGDRSQSLQASAWFGYEGAVPLTIRNREYRDQESVAQMRRAVVSGNFFAVLGSAPVIGRTLTNEDDKQGAAPVAVISYKVWQKKYAGSLNVIGKTIERHDDSKGFTIVGVMPNGLDFPRGTECWLPINAATPTGVIAQLAYSVVGRLKPSASATNAANDVTAFFAQNKRVSTRDFRGTVESFTEAMVGDTKPAVIAFAVAVLLLLLITCFNVANLLFVRGITRVREIGIRAALGATRAEIITQLLAENGLLALVGGALGVGVAAISVQAFIAFAPATLPRLAEVELNLNALYGAIGITAFSLLVFAVTPALLTSRVQPQDALRAGGRHGTSRSERRFMESLVGVQIAFAVLALSAAGVTAASLIRLQNAKLAFDGSHVLIGELAVRADEYGTTGSQLTMTDKLMRAVQSVTGVQSVTPVVAAPFSGNGGWDGAFTAAGQSTADASNNALVNMEIIAPSYFTTFGIAPVQGRAFTDADRAGAAPVIIINEATARQYWPHENAVGKELSLGSHKMTVIGIVPNMRYRDLRDVRLSAYLPLQQSFFPFAPLTIAVRTLGAPANATSSIRRAIAEAVPGVVLAHAAPFENYLNVPLAQPRLNAVLLVVFGTTAVLLAAVGLFGTMMTMVRLRTKELGVRMALGATPRNVQRLVFTRGGAITLAGTAVGTAVALMMNRLLQSMLFETSSADPLVIGVVTLVLTLVMVTATAIPTWATTRISPVVALKSDG